MPQPNGRFDILLFPPPLHSTLLPTFFFPGSSGPFSFSVPVPFLSSFSASRGVSAHSLGVLSPPDTLRSLSDPRVPFSSSAPTPKLDGDGVAMSTEYQDLSDGQGSPAPSNAGSTGTSGITVRNGPQGQPLSFRR